MSKAAMALGHILIAAALLLGSPASAGDLVWQFSKKQNRPYLQAMSSEPETDRQFWAHCRAEGGIDIGMGAESNVGEGNEELVTLTLTSAGATAVLAGNSRKSVNFQMTAGVELQAKVMRDDAVFKVLATGAPIAVSGSMKPVTWPVKGLKAKVAAFLQACK
jgi:hypothetical protein